MMGSSEHSNELLGCFLPEWLLAFRKEPSFMEIAVNYNIISVVIYL
jgi:hypothetical protein